jgi:hypothetical protein
MARRNVRTSNLQLREISEVANRVYGTDLTLQQFNEIAATSALSWEMTTREQAKKVLLRLKVMEIENIGKGGDLQMDEFLPQDYEAPNTDSKYMKFEEGVNNFRVLSKAVVGWEWWTDGAEDAREVHRVKSEAEVPGHIRNQADTRKKAKHFWSMVVHNNVTNQIQILHITQTSIRNAILSLAQNPKWGNPREYDINVIKTKTGSKDFDVEYTVQPDPKSPVSEEIMKQYEEMKIDLQALFSNEDPFARVEQVEEDAKIPF